MKVYKRKTGIIVVSGEVKSIEPAQNGAKKVVFIVKEYNKQSHELEDKEISVTSSNVTDAVAVGSIATAAGYQWGAGNIMGTYISAGPHVECVDNDIEIVSGLVNKAVYKSELNEDGSPRLKRDGTPRKPHFDISVVIPDEEGHRVFHIVKVYNFNKKEDSQLSNIEKMQKRFADFKDKDSTPIECTIVTAPGQIRPWESEYNGQVYQNYCCDHMGVFSMDLNFLFSRERDNERPEGNSQTSSSPAPSNPAPFPVDRFSEPTAQQSPAMNPPIIEDEDVFK